MANSANQEKHHSYQQQNSHAGNISLCLLLITLLWCCPSAQYTAMLVHHYNLSVFFHILQTLNGLNDYNYYLQVWAGDRAVIRAQCSVAFRTKGGEHLCCTVAVEQAGKGSSWPEAHWNVHPCNKPTTHTAASQNQASCHRDKAIWVPLVINGLLAPSFVDTKSVFTPCSSLHQPVPQWKVTVWAQPFN